MTSTKDIRRQQLESLMIGHIVKNDKKSVQQVIKNIQLQNPKSKLRDIISGNIIKTAHSCIDKG